MRGRPATATEDSEGRAANLTGSSKNLLHRLATTARSLLADTVSGEDRLFYWLQSPRCEELSRAGRHRFSGWCLWYGDRIVEELAVALDDAPPLSVAVDQPRDEIARNAPGAAGASRCGFSTDIEVPEAAGRCTVTARFADGGRERLLEIDLHEQARRRAELDRLRAAVDALPLPDAELVFLTQGMRDPEFYGATIVPAALNTCAYLEASGLPPSSLADVLDFGCGSGRLLAGWFALDPRRRLAGCDISHELVSWARANLPASLDLRVTDPHPPLPYRDGAFDAVFAVSVFTHLSLASQRRWVEELRRVVRPGGAVLVTLHGASYLPLIFPGRPETADELRRAGHLVAEPGREGSNEYASVHTRGFARRQFSGFDLAGFFPNGRLGGRRLPHPVFILQDVYVFRRRP